MNAKSLFKKISLALLAFLVLVMLILLIALYLAPGIGIYVANNWYSQQGKGYQLEAQDWHFAPFTMQLELNNVVLQHPQHGSEKTELNKVFLQLNPWALIRKEVVVQAIELDGLNLELALEASAQQQLDIAGLSIPLAAQESTETEDEQETEVTEPWQIEVKKIALTNFHLGWQMQLDDLAVTGRAILNQLIINDFSTAATAQPSINLAMQLTSLQLSNPELTLLEPLTITAQGQLYALMSEPAWRGDISLHNLSLEQELLTASFKHLVLKNITASATEQSLATLQLENIEFGAEGIAGSIEELIVSDLSATAEQQRVGSVQIHDIRVDEFAQQLHGQLAHIELTDMSNENRQQHLSHLELSGLKLSSGAKQLLSLANYQLEELQLEEQEEVLTFNLGHHQYAGLEVDLERNKQGELVGLTPAIKDEASVTAEQVQSSAEEPALSLVMIVALAEFLQQNDSLKSRIAFSDNSIKPAFKTNITLKKFEIGQVSSQINGAHVSLKQAIPMLLEFQLGDFSTTEITANLSTYETQGQIYPEGTIKIKTRKLDMVELNGYLIEAIGYQLNRGSLDVDAHITIHQTKLGGEVKLLLRNSQFVPADEEIINRVSKQISMPLETALGLLRDKNGNINLTIPLEGKLTDPDFGLKDVVRQLSNKALKAATVFFLKQSLQPYGTMISIASFAGDYLFAIRLDALSYAEKQSALNDDHKAHLKKVGELMQSKKSIEVRACPFVNEQEAMALGDNWANLAHERGQQVQQWFSENFSEQAERLTVCRPQKGKSAEVVLGVN